MVGRENGGFVRQLVTGNGAMETERGMMLLSLLPPLFLFIQSGTPGYAVVSPTFRIFLVNPFWKHLQIDPEVCCLQGDL